MGGACGTYGREMRTGFWWGDLREADHFEDPDVDGRIIIGTGEALTGLAWLRMS
jgi:hypothetical protein